MVESKQSFHPLALAYDRMLARAKETLALAREETLPSLKHAVESASQTAVDLGELTREEADVSQPTSGVICTTRPLTYSARNVSLGTGCDLISSWWRISLGKFLPGWWTRHDWSWIGWRFKSRAGVMAKSQVRVP